MECRAAECCYPAGVTNAQRNTRLLSLTCGIAVAFGCGGPYPQAADPMRTPTASPDPPAQTVAAPTPMDAGAASAAASAAPVDAGPPPKPAPVTRTGKTWPFHAWDHAEAVAFNQLPMRPRIQRRAYDDDGWTQHLAQKKPIDGALAKKAVELVMRTEGDVNVSQCPFPRHAVVLYEGATPVASINVCFSCGDIMLWPRWEPEQDWEKLNDKQRKAFELREKKQKKLYDAAFPMWKAFFRDEVGYAIDVAYHEQPGGPI